MDKNYVPTHPDDLELDAKDLRIRDQMIIELNRLFEAKGVPQRCFPFNRGGSHLRGIVCTSDGSPPRFGEGGNVMGDIMDAWDLGAWIESLPKDEIDTAEEDLEKMLEELRRKRDSEKQLRS